MLALVARLVWALAWRLRAHAPASSVVARGYIHGNDSLIVVQRGRVVATIDDAMGRPRSIAADQYRRDILVHALGAIDGPACYVTPRAFREMYRQTRPDVVAVDAAGITLASGTAEEVARTLVLRAAEQRRLAPAADRPPAPRPDRRDGRPLFDLGQYGATLGEESCRR